MNPKKVLGIIPARYASSRFPGKPLVDIRGKSMIQRVYEQAISCSALHELIVATDDTRILKHVLAFGGKAEMTDADHQSGTDRCAEIVEKRSDIDYVVNIQGDEPFIDPQQINLIVTIVKNSANCSIATLVKKIKAAEQLFNPNIVKAVFNQQKEALYFSRHPLPFQRALEQDEWLDQGDFYKHIGMYAFERNSLLKLAQLPQSPLEKAESLEQLRWLDNGYKIAVGITTIETVGIDTPEDLVPFL